MSALWRIPAMIGCALVIALCVLYEWKVKRHGDQTETDGRSRAKRVSLRTRAGTSKVH